MMLFLVTIWLCVFFVQQSNANFLNIGWNIALSILKCGINDHSLINMLFAKNKHIDIRYWNQYHGNNKSLQIKVGHEDILEKYWIPKLPLKVIIHGWITSSKEINGIFGIKRAYVNTGGFNVLTVDWRSLTGNKIYPVSALFTSDVGSRLAKVLKNMVKLGIIEPKDIHLIGHSLGAHIAGECGSLFDTDKIGRITGLDPAGPGFEYVRFQNVGGLNYEAASFVDVIHTSGGSTGCLSPMGHVDFYPNGGFPPQPGCFEGIKLMRLIGIFSCSHSRAYKLYEESVYHPKSMTAVQCPSWTHFNEHKCDNNAKILFGHNVPLNASGNYYLITNSKAPYAHSSHNKEDL